MTYRPILAVLALLCCGCHTDHEMSLGLPSTAPSSTKQPVPTIGPGATPTSAAPVGAAGRVQGPHGVLPGCLTASALLPVVEWRIASVPAGAKVTQGYSHSADVGCGATSNGLRTENAHLRVERDPRDPTTLIIQFDKSTDVCGHTQVDISIDGGNVLGEVLDYGSACDPPPPDCTVTGTCQPPPCTNAPCQPPPVAWQSDMVCGGFTPSQDITTIADMEALGARLLASDGTDDSHESPTLHMRHQQVCDGVVVDADVAGNVATIRVDDPAPQLIVSLLMFRKNGVSWVPQTFVAGQSLAITAPGTYSLTVRSPQ
jgi:hypothetical protein